MATPIERYMARKVCKNCHLSQKPYTGLFSKLCKYGCGPKLRDRRARNK